MPALVKPKRIKATAPLSISDNTRVRIPGFTPHTPLAANYWITPLGHIYRDDGLLIRPSLKLVIKFNGGRISRALPRLVFLAFGRREDLPGWRAWVPPDSPLDPVTGRRSCSVRHVFLVPHGELISHAGGLPETKVRII